jgi:hypothetical protein
VVPSLRPALCRTALLVALLASSAACRNAAPELPPAPAPPAPARAAAPYRPALEESVRRIAAVVADGGAAPVPTRVVRLELPTPPAVDVVAARFGERWVVAAVERDRVTPGLLGAERIHQLAVEAGRPLSAVDLARVVGALHYYPWRVFDGGSWSQTGTHDLPHGEASPPMITPREGGGRTLTFSYWIPEGSPGAGMHLGNFRVTDSGLIIDQAPNPTRR